MIRFVFAALWVVAVTIGTIFYAFSATGEQPQTKGESPCLGGLDYLETEMMSVPVVRNGEVQGYFLARLVYAIEPEKLRMVSLPVDTLLVDQLYTYLFASPHIDFARTDRLDIEAMRSELRDSINARVGETLVHDVLVRQVDYLTKEQIRDNALRRRDAQGGVNRPTLKAR